MTSLVAGCNPFRTGTPDPPAGSTVTYPQATTADNVLAILALSMEAEDTPAYLERLDESFTFTPDPVQAGGDDFRNFPETWTRASEESFLTGLLSNSDSVSVTWEQILTEPTGTGYHVTASYQVLVGSLAGGDTYSGRAEMDMQESSGLLYIHSWSDVVLEGDSRTWGLLRALLATG